MKVAVGQFGAPTAVLNATLFGALEVFDFAKTEVIGAVGGPNGLIHREFIPLRGRLEGLHWLLETPGAALLAGRKANFSASVEHVMKNLRHEGVEGLLVIGGNGTMAMADCILQAAKADGYDLQVVGVPKTIDNDLIGVDHTPGFPSAAQFVLQALSNLVADLESMVGFEQVRIVEVMGRKTGWLAATASLFPEFYYLSKAGIDPIVCLPERPLRVESLIRAVQEHVREDGCAIVVVSEGVCDVTGEQVLQMGQQDSQQAALMMLGGIGAWLAEVIRKRTSYVVRYENLGLLQRCWADCQVKLDRDEAVHLGQAGAKLLLDGKSGTMVGLARDDVGFYQTHLVHLPFSQVGGSERTVPDQFLNEKTYQKWLCPLLDLSKLHPYPVLARRG